MEPPYWAVLFTSVLSEDDEGYAEVAERMLELAARQPGFLGVETARGADRVGITISYWESEAAIEGWRRNAEHLAVQREGRARWYDDFTLRVARVQRAWGK